MNHASLFSGIGGFDLAAEWMGWTNVLHCERDPFCQRVLKYHFPNAKTYNDVKTFDGTEWRGRVDILTGGFPCQPYSSAGKRLGKDDERHLWPQMCRIISEVAPAYVVGENVRGLTNWNGGVVFEEVCADLEAAGYEVWTGILPAAGVGAPHRRDRVWFVAHAHGGADVRTPGRHAGTGTGEGVPERHEVRISDQSGDVWDAANAGHKRPQRRKKNGNLARGGAERDQLPTRCIFPTWEIFPTQSPVCGGDDGLPRELDGVTFSKWRAESIKAYGNAIVPQVAYQIFQAIQTTHDN
jgi:DNA (cytosine-5)-methyltransferase 1